MTIDWITVGAQIANFLILVYLLKRFLYGPILRAMDRREQAIAARIADAETQVRAAQQEKELYESKHRAIEAERRTVLEQAHNEARDDYARSVDELRTEIDGKREEWLKALENEQSNLTKDLRKSLSERVRVAIERILSDLASADLERQAIDRFLAELRELPEDERRSLARRTKGEHRPFVFATAFELEDDRRREIESALRELLAPDIEVSFEQRKDLVCGGALEASGQRYSWSVDSYLDDISSTITETLAMADRRPQAG